MDTSSLIGILNNIRLAMMLDAGVRNHIMDKIINIRMAAIACFLLLPAPPGAFLDENGLKIGFNFCLRLVLMFVLFFRILQSQGLVRVMKKDLE